MWRKRVRNLRFISHYIFDLVRILFPATIAPDIDALGKHGKSRVSVRLAQKDAMLVASIAFVMDATVLADYDPVVIGCVSHGAPRVPLRPPGLGVLDYALVWR